MVVTTSNANCSNDENGVAKKVDKDTTKTSDKTNEKSTENGFHKGTTTTSTKASDKTPKKSMKQRKKKGDEELQQDLIDKLLCPICMELIVPPINQCRNGHTICSHCLSQLKDSPRTCPECRVEMRVPCRALVLEQLAATQVLSCSHVSCPMKMNYTELNTHKQVCEYRPVSCRICRHLEPFESWDALWEHIDEEHFSNKTNPIRTRNQSCVSLRKDWLNDLKGSKINGKAWRPRVLRVKKEKDASSIRCQLKARYCPEENNLYVALVELGPPSCQHYSLEISGLLSVVYSKLPILSYRTSFRNLKEKKCAVVPLAGLMTMSENCQLKLKMTASIT